MLFYHLLGIIEIKSKKKKNKWSLIPVDILVDILSFIQLRNYRLN